MCTKEDEEMAHAVVKSPNRRQIQKEYDQILKNISKKVDISKLPNKKPLRVDKYGNVDISPDHPNYKFWTEDD
ncbi:hypothetical protein JNUCC74_02615 [Cerasibacillus sp. JNUCC 74]|jgi:hypothetical protein